MVSHRRAWLALIVAVGVALAALSPVDAWVNHDRFILGEGYREVKTTLVAWDAHVAPALAAGVTAALLTALAAALMLAGALRRLPAGTLAVCAAIGLGLMGAELVPLSQAGQASRVDLSPGWALFAGTLLAAVMLTASLAADPPGRRTALMLPGALAVAALVGVGSQWAVLQARGGSNQAWSAGSYTREAAGQPPLTLTISNGRYTIGSRWSGTWESRGWIVSLDADAACPGSRGTYHVHGHPGPQDEDLRFVKIVDTCEDGARSRELEAGVWRRDR